MDVSAVVIGVSLIGAAIGGSASYAIVKFGVKHDIKSIKEKNVEIVESIKAIERKKEDTDKYIILARAREESQVGREKTLIDALKVSVTTADRMVNTLQEFVKVDLTGLKNDVSLIKTEISWFTEQRSKEGRTKK